jgi:hypothetical protein
MLNVDFHGFLYRFIASAAGLAIAGIGFTPLLRHGDVTSTNWFGGLVFAPLAILFGVFIVVCALFKPDWLANKPAGRPRRTNRWR